MMMDLTGSLNEMSKFVLNALFEASNLSELPLKLQSEKTVI